MSDQQAPPIHGNNENETIAFLAEAGIILSEDPDIREDQLANPESYTSDGPLDEFFEAADISAEIVDGGVRVILFIPLAGVTVNLTPEPESYGGSDPD